MVFIIACFMFYQVLDEVVFSKPFNDLMIELRVEWSPVRRGSVDNDICAAKLLVYLLHRNLVGFSAFFCFM